MMKALPFFERFGFVLVGCGAGLALNWPTNPAIGPMAAATAIVGLMMSIGSALAGRRSAKETGGRAEQALRIIESMPALAWFADQNGKFIYMSRSPRIFTGLPVKDLFPTENDEFGLRNVLHPDDFDRVIARWRHSLLTGDQYDCEHRIRRSDGVYRWIRSFGSPARDSGGQITAWYGTTIDVDEQKKAEAALQESERSLQQLIDTVPVLIWCLSPDGTPTYLNKQLVNYTGASIEQLSSLEAVVKDIIHPDDAAAVTNAVQHAITTGAPLSLRHRLRCSDGTFRWVAARAKPMCNAEGEIVQWYGVCFDVDGEVQAGEALRRSERQLRQLIDAVPFNILSFAPSGKLTSASKRYSEQVGSPPKHIEDFEGLARHLAHPEDLSKMLQRALEGFATGQPFMNRFRRRDKHGVYRWIEARAQPLLDTQGVIVQWYIASIDIEDEVRTQEELLERERFLWQLVETLPAMIDCAAPDGEPIYRSQRLREFLGYELEELDGEGRSRLTRTLDAGVHPDDVAGVKEGYAHSLATGEPYARRHRLRRYDGEYRWVETRAGPMRNSEGAVVQWNVICLDIENEVRAQEELRLAQDRLARASQAASLAELSASIAHEVNQPLAAVVANSHACQRWLKAEPPNIERAHTTVERIIRDANGAAEVVSRIRALFKPSMETRSSMALSCIIAEVRSLLTEEAVRRSVRMDIAIESSLPAVAVDRVQIQQVLINLIRNGIEAMDAVRGERILRVSVRRVAEAVQTEISDCGAGIELVDRIFEPFFTTKERGMGMGLAICRSIIESHGGRLWAQTNEVPGATFIFTLPIEAKDAV